MTECMEGPGLTLLRDCLACHRCSCLASRNISSLIVAVADQIDNLSLLICWLSDTGVWQLCIRYSLLLLIWCISCWILLTTCCTDFGCIGLFAIGGRRYSMLCDAACILRVMLLPCTWRRATLPICPVVLLVVVAVLRRGPKELLRLA